MKCTIFFDTNFVFYKHRKFEKTANHRSYANTIHFSLKISDLVSLVMQIHYLIKCKKCADNWLRRYTKFTYGVYNLSH